MRYYQLSYLLSPKIEKKKINEIEKEISSFLEKNGGILEKIEEPLKRTLFYPIKKFKEAFLGSVYFFLEPEMIKELEKKLKEKNEILRFLVLSEKAPKKVPSPKKVTKPKKVELKEFEKKLEEFLGQ